MEVTHGWPETGFFTRILRSSHSFRKNPVSLVLAGVLDF